ncbi:MAG: hypothetical protein HOA06_05885 [Chloroflexi bacterium]|nr:hypothetical protein [Chloroflexota bacterium]MBT7004237.1 hypothetical protein [Chloroflexota bacterium]
MIKIIRVSERGDYDKETIYSIFDDGYLCHVAYESDHGPVVLPTLYGRTIPQPPGCFVGQILKRTSS